MWCPQAIHLTLSTSRIYVAATTHPLDLAPCTRHSVRSTNRSGMGWSTETRDEPRSEKREDNRREFRLIVTIHVDGEKYLSTVPACSIHSQGSGFIYWLVPLCCGCGCCGSLRFHSDSFRFFRESDVVSVSFVRQETSD